MCYHSEAELFLPFSLPLRRNRRSAEDHSKETTTMKQSLLALLAFCSLALPSRAAVIDPGAFAYTASFTVSGYAGSAPLENFPVLVRLSAKSADGFVILHDTDGDYDANKPLTFGAPNPATRTFAISASMVPPDSGTTATLTLLYKTDLRAAGYSEAEVQVSDIDATGGTATVTLPAAFDNIDTAFFFGFKNEDGVDD